MHSLHDRIHMTHYDCFDRRLDRDDGDRGRDEGDEAPESDMSDDDDYG